MIETALATTDVKSLDVFSNRCELRRDLHVFVDYVRHNDVKRSVRGNRLSKADALKLAKMMTNPEDVQNIKETGEPSPWVGYIDWLAREMAFVSYDTKGTYIGYTSSEPSFPDNYIKFNEKTYQKFLESSLEQQEWGLVNTLLEYASYSHNEFYETSVHGMLDGFDYWGSATNVMPLLQFAKVRRFLLDILKECRSGIWYSTASLIEYLKENHPFFLIPQKPKVERGRYEGRYANFYEHKGDRWSNRIQLTETTPNVFEKVEGRYVERFLEGIPLVMRYVDVAYGKKQDKDLFPSIGQLKAFRVNDRFLRVMNGQIPAPKVTIQPNFEVHVESEFYPAQVMAQLTPLAEVVSEDTAIVLKLQKAKVAAELIENEKLDVLSLLRSLTGREVPQNVVTELEEWAGHSEMFTLYDGFALLEGDEDVPAADEFTVEKIAPRVRLVHSPDKLFARLEKAELVPLRIKHSDAALRPLPEKARTAFAKESQVAKPKEKERVILKRETTVTLHFPDGDLLEKFRKGLLNAHCLFESDAANRTITFGKRHEAQVKEIIKALGSDYIIRIEDIE